MSALLYAMVPMGRILRSDKTGKDGSITPFACHATVSS